MSLVLGALSLPRHSRSRNVGAEVEMAADRGQALPDQVRLPVEANFDKVITAAVRAEVFQQARLQNSGGSSRIAQFRQSNGDQRLRNFQGARLQNSSGSSRISQLQQGDRLRNRQQIFRQKLAALSDNGQFRRGDGQFRRGNRNGNRFQNSRGAFRRSNGGRHWCHSHRRHCSHSFVYFSSFGYPYWGGYPWYGYSTYDPVIYADYAGDDGSIVFEIQQHLAEAGFYHGPIDGIIGGGTRRDSGLGTGERAPG